MERGRRTVENQQESTNTQETGMRETPALYSDWFCAAGDLDDFIFYGEDEAHVSER